MPDSAQWLSAAKQVLNIEADSVRAQIASLDEGFIRACHTILQTKGRLIVLGMGKSGHIGAKLAATFASTGTPAFFVHPAEAQHGDMGMITADDCLLALSYSGESHEITQLIPIVQRLGVSVIGITGNPKSAIAQQADIHLPIHIEREACPLGLAPTSSSTATLALGDALAVALIEARGFSSEDFARSHPGGRLGRRLITRVADVMRCDHAVPRSQASDTLQQALFEITDKQLGLTLICDHNRLLGIYTDGDLRRSLEQHGHQALSQRIDQHMTTHPRHTSPDTLARDALALLEQHKITALPVLDKHTLVGVIHIHDLLRAGVA